MSCKIHIILVSELIKQEETGLSKYYVWPYIKVSIFTCFIPKRTNTLYFMICKSLMPIFKLMFISNQEKQGEIKLIGNCQLYDSKLTVTNVNIAQES